ncbi:hypothetical protein [Dictyobacter arantiisoli]|uniref:Uncharacterized protein n=1 Tax=Dictyobacter arantiisoli TaxID=2014874 RepID=A0A5A5TGU3_9CHLR|nr:hypothetical protein [Dictyobacter arantiisoli]GCF10283.1 hypothetical protein KDI_38470 [Dictyobacter arantiisoli]
MANDQERYYKLPLEAIIETMRMLRETGILQTTVASLPMISKKNCKVQIALISGKMATCEITSSEGQPLLQGEAALYALRGSGDLEWTNRRETSSQAMTTQTMHIGQSSTRERLPCRRAEITAAHLQMLTHLQRQIIALADGKTSVAKMATLSGRDERTIKKMIDILRENHWLY